MPKKIVTNVLPFRTKKHILAAYDEAGHAVAATQKGCPIKSVSILPSSISLGKLARTTLLSRIDVEMPAMSEDIIRRNRGRIEDAIFITLAGPYAQRRFDPSSNWDDDSENSDLDEAWNLIGDLQQSQSSCCGEAAVAYRQYMEALATVFVDQMWSGIEAIAQRLLERHTITEDEMKEVCGAALMAELKAAAVALGIAME